MEKPKKLGEMLMEAGIISESQLNRALTRQRTWGGRLGSNLVMTGALQDEDLRRFLALQTGVPTIDIETIVIPKALVKKVPQRVAEQYNMIPVAMEDADTLLVACTDPTDLAGLDQIRFITGHKIKPALASHAELLKAIQRCYLGLGESNSPRIVDPNAAAKEEQFFMEHGGHASEADPDLILFDQKTSDTPTLELDLELADPDIKPHEENLRPMTGPPDHSAHQVPPTGKLIAMYNVLLRKGLITEGEINDEYRRLRELGRID